MAAATPALAEIDTALLARLDEAWRPARDAGAVGTASLHSLRLHASGYLLEDWRRRPGGCFVDCGSGAGILGILLAWELPSSRWTLVDSSERRCEFAQLAVAAAGLKERVVVEHSLVEDVARRPESRASFDGAVARLFGPPSELAECGLPLLRIGGMLVVSVSAATRELWARMPLTSRTGCRIASEWTTPFGSFLAVKRISPVPEGIPRRKPARKRSPFVQ